MKRYPAPDVFTSEWREFRPMIIWYSCRYCGIEFRREKGWTRKTYSYGLVVNSYCCDICYNAGKGDRV